MANRDKITYEQFIDAVEIMAIVIADDHWRRFRDETQPVNRPLSDSNWLDSKEAGHYVRLGATKFRELIKQGVFPAGQKVGGKFHWDRRELDRRMAAQIREQSRLAHRIH
jgi:hypothetical protein